MSKAKIEITAKFGSEFQRNYARDSLLIMLRCWKQHLGLTHKKNDVDVFVNGDRIEHLDFFNWED